MVDSYKSIKEIKQYAEENNVPIMQEEGIDFIITFIIKHQIKSILEIGTAIGYSALTRRRYPGKQSEKYGWSAISATLSDVLFFP